MKCLYMPNKGFIEYIDKGGVSYARSIGKAMCFPCREAVKNLLECRPPKSTVVEVERHAEGVREPYKVYCEDKAFAWSRQAIDVACRSDRELLEELCHRVIDYHATSLKFHDCERGTPDEVMDNDNNYCRVREVVKHVLGIDLEYLEEGALNNDENVSSSCP